MSPSTTAMWEEAVLAPVNAFLACVGACDRVTMLALVLPDCGLTRMEGGKVERMSIADLAAKLPPASAGLDERIHDPLVRVDGDLAVVWAPYTLSINGKTHHRGTDLFNLVRIEGRWMISALAYTVEACAV